MSQRIKVLPEKLANMIAAGEVVERPASVVKELIENAVDANADRIEINCQGSGKRMIRVLDNGMGMEYEDALTCLERHATSKIQSESDLKSIHTLGFRGEALPSIASVSEMILTTRPASSNCATKILLKAGVIKQVTKAGSPIGTMVEVKNLFSNIPARAKFLRSPQTELTHIVQTVTRQSIPRHDISFILTNDGQTLLHLTKAMNLRERLSQITGPELMDHMLEIESEREGIHIQGYISNMEWSRSNLIHQYLYVNRRFIKSPIIQKAIHSAYHPSLPRHRYPVFCLLIDIDPHRVDFNVHPTKLEIRFDHPSRIVDFVSTCIKERIALPKIWTRSTSHSQPMQEMRTKWIEAPKSEMTHDLPSVLSKKSMHQIPLVKEKSEGGYGDGYENSIKMALEPACADLDKADTRMELVPLGPCIQIDRSYIIYEIQDGLVIIDQHAAHERINFEKIKSSFHGEKPPKQSLLSPPLINVSHEEDALMEKVMLILNDMGFTLEPFGVRTYILRSVPIFLNTDPVQILQAIIQKFLEFQSVQEKDQMIEPISATMACHLSVKANQSLKPQEIQQLIHDLLATEQPYSCPHGRPTLFRISKREIEKNLGR